MVLGKIIIILILVVSAFFLGSYSGENKAIKTDCNAFLDSEYKRVQVQGSQVCTDKDFKFINAYPLSNEYYVTTCKTDSPCKAWSFTEESK